MYPDVSPSEAKLLDSYEELRFNARRRRVDHDDPSGAAELDYRANTIAKKLLASNPALEVYGVRVKRLM